jgi:hypothetical protein
MVPKDTGPTVGHEAQAHAGLTRPGSVQCIGTDRPVSPYCTLLIDFLPVRAPF